MDTPEGKAENMLYYGDNLDILKRYIKDETVDLIYLDPPFQSGQDYNVLFKEHNGSSSAAQIMAFEDTWHWDQAAAKAFEDALTFGGRLADTMEAFRRILRSNDMLAYLSMMAPRLIEMKRVLKQAGTIYLHCDPTASHHLKILMDAVFSPACFKNEIIWSYRRWPTPSKMYQRMHDVILFYVRDPNQTITFNVDYEPVSESYWKRFKGKTQMLDPETGTRKITLEAETRGMPRRDVWELSIIAGSKKERLGYPTQKPESLLERIISTSSNEGDLVLDPFCGCGTTIAVAQRLRRQWIGIDITHLAITLMRHRLKDAFGETVSYTVIGEPVSLPDAQALAQQDPYQFQWWALGLVGARPVEQKKGADKGIDGRLYFFVERSKSEQIIFSVKAGNVTSAHVRDLHGVVDREKAAIGVLISLNEPTPQMRSEAADAGFYTSKELGNPKYPRIQLLTIEDLLKGKKVECPDSVSSRETNPTFTQAPKAKKQPLAKREKQSRLSEHSS